MKTTARKSSNKESPTVFWIPPLSSETSEPSSQKVTPQAIRDWLMSLPEGSRARMLTAMGLLNTKQPDIGSVLNARLGRSILKTVTTGEKGGWDENNKRSRMNQKYREQTANKYNKQTTARAEGLMCWMEGRGRNSKMAREEC